MVKKVLHRDTIIIQDLEITGFMTVFTSWPLAPGSPVDPWGPGGPDGPISPTGPCTPGTPYTNITDDDDDDVYQNHTHLKKCTHWWSFRSGCTICSYWSLQMTWTNIKSQPIQIQVWFLNMRTGETSPDFPVIPVSPDGLVLLSGPGVRWFLEDL